MTLETRDAEIAHLFEKLKGIETGYPPHLLEARRLYFRQRVAEVSLGLGVSTVTNNSTKPKSGEGGTRTGKIIELLLLVAIAGEASATIYFYRNRIVDYIRTYNATPQVAQTSPPSNPVSAILNPSATSAPSSIEISPTLTITPTSFAIPTGTTGANLAAGNQGNSTPEPNGNNGNHFGQTPKPERTKDNGNGKDK